MEHNSVSVANGKSRLQFTVGLYPSLKQPTRTAYREHFEDKKPIQIFTSWI